VKYCILENQLEEVWIKRRNGDVVRAVGDLALGDHCLENGAKPGEEYSVAGEGLQKKNTLLNEDQGFNYVKVVEQKVSKFKLPLCVAC
jgi:hypothetical protein